MNKLSEFFYNMRLFLVLIWDLVLGIFGKDIGRSLSVLYATGILMVLGYKEDFNKQVNEPLSIIDKHKVRCSLAIYDAVRHLLALIIILARSNEATHDIELIITETRTWEKNLEGSVLMKNALASMDNET